MKLFQLYESLEDVRAATEATRHRAVALRLAIQEVGNNTNQFDHLVSVATRACQIEQELRNGERDQEGCLLTAGQPQEMSYVYNQSAANKAIAIQQALRQLGVDADPWSIAGRAVNIENGLTRPQDLEPGLTEFLPRVAETSFAHSRQETHQEDDFQSCVSEDEEVTYQHPKPLLVSQEVNRIKDLPFISNLLI